MNRRTMQRTRGEIAELATSGLDWVSFATEATDVLRRTVPFDKSCWHTVDPGTILITASLNQNIACSGYWVAEHEYVLDDVNKYSFLVSTGFRAAALSHATHGDLSRSTRARDSAAFGNPMGDELRIAFIGDGIFWGGADLIRDSNEPFFDNEAVQFMASMSTRLAEGMRRAIVSRSIEVEEDTADAPGLVVLGPRGELVSISAQAERWIAQLPESPPPPSPQEARAVQVVAACARNAKGTDNDHLAARVRAQTKQGTWLLLYATPLSGTFDQRVAVIIQPAGLHDVAPLIAAAYGLSEQERRVTRLCLRGLSTEQIGNALHISAYTVQDHLKSIFSKTGVRSRAEFVGQIFLEHYVSRMEDLENLPPAWLGKEVADPLDDHQDRVPK